MNPAPSVGHSTPRAILLQLDPGSVTSPGASSILLKVPPHPHGDTQNSEKPCANSNLISVCSVGTPGISH